MALSPQEEQKLADAIKFLTGAIKGMTLYPPKHPSVHKPLAACYDAIKPLLRFMGKLTFTTMDGILILAERPFYDTNIHAKDLLGRFEQRNITHLDFMDGLTIEELEVLALVLQMEPKALAAAGGVSKELKSRGVKHIRSSNTRMIYDNAINIVNEMIRETRMGRIPNSEDAKSVVEDMKGMILEDKGALIGLSLIKSYDEYLFNHSVNVSVLALALAEEVGVPEDQLSVIGLAGLLHDLGKIQTPKEIVNKPGRLSEDEWEIMKEHPVKSYEIVKKMTGISEMAARIIYEHHVHFNHKGYPRLPEGQKAHQFSQIVSIADTYDAMTTLRPYQKAFTPKEALDTMEKNLVGKTIDPSYFETFVKMLGIYPIGTLVRLDTNEIALVVDVKPENYMLPKVKVVMDPSGRLLTEPIELDLSKLDESKGDAPRSVISTVDPLLANIDTAQYI